MRDLKRWFFLFAGFACYGLAIAMMVRADLGLGPWDAFNQGLAKLIGVKIGTTAMIVGAVVMLGRLPLRQKPGIGTAMNVLCIGPMTIIALDYIHTPAGIGARWALMLGGIVVISIGSAHKLPTKL